jgi:hypothetical protein
LRVDSFGENLCCGASEMPNPTTGRPEASEFSPAVADYIGLVPQGDLIEILTAQSDELARLVRPLSDEQALVHHAPYTWSIKQVVGRLSDCERVFGYRAMRLARNDATALPGFDENAYMQFSEFDACAIGELLSGFSDLRRSNVSMLRCLPADAWMRRAVVNGHPMTARAVACVMAGHTEHHLRILRQRLAR